jgi:hypothetical protein
VIDKFGADQDEKDALNIAFVFKNSGYELKNPQPFEQSKVEAIITAYSCLNSAHLRAKYDEWCQTNHQSGWSFEMWIYLWQYILMHFKSHQWVDREFKDDDWQKPMVQFASAINLTRMASDPVYRQAIVEFCEWLTEKGWDHFRKRFYLATTLSGAYLDKLHNGWEWHMGKEFKNAPPDYWVTPRGVSVLHKAFKFWNKHIRGNPIAQRVQEHKWVGIWWFSLNDSWFVEFQKAGWDHFLKFLDWGGHYQAVCFAWWKQLYSEMK